MKKCISLLLTVCLLATMAVVPALAEAGTYTGAGAGKNGEGQYENANKRGGIFFHVLPSTSSSSPHQSYTVL